MKKEKTGVSESLKMLRTGLEEVFASDQYKQYLAVMARFYHYSFRNCLLIAMQFPEATQVAGYSTWRSLGRYVRKGEKGIRILAPCPIRKKKDEQKDSEEDTELLMFFKMATVFDISQTDGEPIPSLGVEELRGEIGDYDQMLDTIKSISPVPIRISEISGGAKGYYSRTEHEIVLQSGMSQAQTIKTALHELAHSILHNENTIDRCQAETEAESCAFVVCKHFGIDTEEYSFPYLAAWSSTGDTKNLMKSLNIINETAGAIISDMKKAIGKGDVK